jgi:hypothetical protein
MPIAGPDKQSSADPKDPAPTDLDPPAEEDAEESTDTTAQPDKRTWQ